MFNVNFRYWTEADVRALIGERESIHLEFKAGEMFLDKRHGEQWIKDVTKAVSAFANTGGGELILGIRESDKKVPAVALSIDGVPGTYNRDQLQRKIEGNLEPYLPGMRVLEVHVEEKTVYVVQVPKGITAYQASDGKYYGRSESESKHLTDRLIRGLMQLGKAASACVVADRTVLSADDEFRQREKRLDDAKLALMRSSSKCSGIRSVGCSCDIRFR